MYKYSSFSYAVEDADRVLNMTMEEINYGKELIGNFLRLEPDLVKIASVGDLVCDVVVVQNLLSRILDYEEAVKFLRDLNSCLLE